MLHFPQAMGSSWLLALLGLGVVLGPLATWRAGRRKARFRRRLESAFARYDWPGPAGIPCRSCCSVICACPAG